MITYQVHGAFPTRFPQKSLPRIAREFGRVRPSKHRISSLIGLSFVSPLRIRRLNRSHRGKDRATDVLSFSSTEGASFPSVRTGEQPELGDIFVCPAIARQEAKRRGIDLEEELVRLVTHGTLHLLGYDHGTEEEEHRMFGLQERILASSLKI
jgi:probable rRNA maturation factor